MEAQKKYKIIFYVRRFDPERDAEPREVQYALDVEKGMTVLDGLHKIKETQDPGLAFRFSCRMGVCGSCAMLINGKPTLACNTQILDVTDSSLTVAPLPNFDIIRDLVPDLVPMFKTHAGTQPYIRRADVKEMENPTGEFFQSPHELEKFLQFTYCIKCGACMAACPTMATDRNYLGPMPLTQIYRYNTDSRDDGKRERSELATAGGLYSCHYAGECSNVCPKGVDPARAIQLMKQDMVKSYLKLGGQKGACAKLHPPITGKEQKPKVPVPPYTVTK
jgi:succinate dehydrogenase / fumarate reductase iron-sulfur subunit